jgi:hypothetical protein
MPKVRQRRFPKDVLAGLCVAFDGRVAAWKDVRAVATVANGTGLNRSDCDKEGHRYDSHSFSW